MNLDLKTDALLALIVLIGGWVGAIFTSPYLTWTTFIQGIVGVVVVAGLVYLRFRMKEGNSKKQGK